MTQFSLVFLAQLGDPTPEREASLLRDCVDQAVLADKVGFDRVWAVEHHALREYAHMSAPEVFLAFVAARTERIRVGHGVVCMPFGYNHPVRVGERAAMLDILSGGRVDLGAGRGGTKQETSLFDIDPTTSTAEVEEALRVIAHLWRDEEFAWSSDRLEITPHPIVPAPLQRPHPPLFLACSHEETLTRAARLGVGALVFGFGGPDEIARLRAVYDDALATRDPAGCVSDAITDHLAALVPAIVLDDADEARRTGLRAHRYFAEAIDHWYQGTAAPNHDTADDDNEAALADRLAGLRERLADMDVQFTPSHGAVYRPSDAYGDPDTAAAATQAMIDAGADEIMYLVQMGTVPQQACLETIRLLGEQVLPRFR